MLFYIHIHLFIFMFIYLYSYSCFFIFIFIYLYSYSCFFILMSNETTVGHVIPGGHSNVPWRLRCPFINNLHNPFRKKFAFRYPVSELLDYKKPKTIGNNGLLFLKTITYCSWTISHNLLRNFWSISIPRSGIYAEKCIKMIPWKTAHPYRYIWKCPYWKVNK